MLPPIFSAAPSLPAEPPVRWVNVVEMKISGASFQFMCSLARIALSTILVPRLSGAQVLYIKMVTRPATGIR